MLFFFGLCMSGVAGPLTGLRRTDSVFVVSELFVDLIFDEDSERVLNSFGGLVTNKDPMA